MSDVGFFARRLNHLFATRRSESGRPLTLTEVSAVTGLPPSYLSMLRKGHIKDVPIERAARLSAFFGVPIDYFAPPLHGAATAQETGLQHALEHPQVSEIAFRASALTPAGRALVLQLIERADALADALSTVKETHVRDEY